MIDTARCKAVKAGLEIDFRVGMIEGLPFPNTSSDVVTASLMIQHLPPELQVRELAEIYRVPRPRGRFLIANFMRPKWIISTPNRQNNLRIIYT